MQAQLWPGVDLSWAPAHTHTVLTTPLTGRNFSPRRARYRAVTGGGIGCLCSYAGPLNVSVLPWHQHFLTANFTFVVYTAVQSVKFLRGLFIWLASPPIQK